MLPRLSAYLACSLDGFIADRNGRLGWLDDAADQAEDYGHAAFMSTVDGMAMGRGTYDFISDIDPLPYDVPVFVFTHRPPPPREGVTFWQFSPHQAVQAWAKQGLRRVYVDGGMLISSFLAQGLIHDLTITVAPRILGHGHRLFNETALRDMTEITHLELVGTQEFPSGMVNLSYRVSERLPA